MTDLERAYAFMEGHISCQRTICSFVSGCGCAAEIADLIAAARREGAEAERAALPAEPPPELIKIIAEAEDDEDVYRAIRAHLLGEGA